MYEGFGGQGQGEIGGGCSKRIILGWVNLVESGGRWGYMDFNYREILLTKLLRCLVSMRA